MACSSPERSRKPTFRCTGSPAAPGVLRSSFGRGWRSSESETNPSAWLLFLSPRAGRGEERQVNKSSRPRAHADDEIVVGRLRNLHPDRAFAAEGNDAFVQLLEQRIGLGVLGVHLVGRLVAGLQN